MCLYTFESGVNTKAVRLHLHIQVHLFLEKPPDTLLSVCVPASTLMCIRALLSPPVSPCQNALKENMEFGIPSWWRT